MPPPRSDGPPPVLDPAEARAALPRVVRVLASWCDDLGAADVLASEAMLRAAALPAGARPTDLASWCLEDVSRRWPDLAAAAPSSEELDPDGVPSGLDDRLALLFVTCDPALTSEDHLVLALRVVAGLDLGEAAVHLGLDRSTTAARLLRAEEALTAARGGFEVPGGRERERRLPRALDCVAAMFGVAHRTSPEPPDALAELGADALSLADGLVDMHPGDTEVRGLRAVVLLGLARRPGRIDADGVALTLDQVDRGRWDRWMLAAGLADAAVAMQGHGRFALEAAIGVLHATAPSAAGTDWVQVVQLYEVLREVWASPGVEVAELAARTQLVVHAFPGNHVEAAQVLDAIERRLVELLEDAPTFTRRDAALALADLRWRTGRRDEAVPTYRRLLDHVTSPSVRAFCERRVSQALGDG